jgi:hypothetical protein
MKRPVCTNFIQHPSVKINSIYILDRQCGFRCNRSIANYTFCIRKIPENKWEYSEVVRSASAFNILQESFDSVRREITYNILSSLGIPRKLLRLNKNVSK